MPTVSRRVPNLKVYVTGLPGVYRTPGCGRGTSVDYSLSGHLPHKAQRMSESPEQVRDSDATVDMKSEPPTPTRVDNPQRNAAARFVPQVLPTCGQHCNLDRVFTRRSTAMSSPLPSHPLGYTSPCFDQEPDRPEDVTVPPVVGVLGAGNFQQECEFLLHFQSQLEKQTCPGMRQSFRAVLWG